MHILLTGGTGMIGQRLCRFWAEQGHRLTVLSREPASVAQRCGATVRGVSQLSELDDDPLDAVVNLAGAPIADRPWTAARRKLLWASRVGLTEQLLTWLAHRKQRPTVLISGSAVGWYGDGGQRTLDETCSPVSEDFASQLCIAWEETAERAKELGMRVVLVRTGLVLAPEGGMLQRMALPFRLGLGGRLGNGRQWMPWIHIDDQVALIDFLLNRESAEGPYNACAPHPVRNREFVKRLGKALHRPALLPLPGPALHLVLGEMAGLLTGGQHALPVRLADAGFSFRYTELQTALGAIFARR